MKTALDVHRELLAREVRHEIVRMRGRITSADDLPGMLELRDGCAAVRCYAVTEPAGRGVVAVLVPSGSTPDDAALCRLLGVRAVRAATADEINRSTDFAAGLVSPVCLPDDVPLVVDSGLAGRHVLYTSAGEGGVALGIRAADLVEATGAQVAPVVAARTIDLDGGSDQVVSLGGTERAAAPRTL